MLYYIILNMFYCSVLYYIISYHTIVCYISLYHNILCMHVCIYTCKYIYTCIYIYMHISKDINRSWYIDVLTWHISGMFTKDPSFRACCLDEFQSSEASVGRMDLSRIQGDRLIAGWFLFGKILWKSYEDHQHQWFIWENPIEKWMMTGGSPMT